MTPRRRIPKIEFVNPMTERVYWREDPADIITVKGNSIYKPEGYQFIGWISYENDVEAPKEPK